jgi:hypothetical protein
MSDIADLTAALEELNNTIDLSDLHQLVGALERHSESLDRHSAALEKQQETDRKILTKSLARQPNTW